MKKNVMCIALAAILLVMAIPAFAAGTVHSNSYSASKVLYRFNTSGSITKSSSDSWLKIKDIVSYSYYCDNDTDEITDSNGRHKTYIVNSSGTVLSGYKFGQGACTITFSSDSEMGNARTENTVKLQIHNPKNGAEYLKTAGEIWGEAKQGIEVDSASPDLDAE